MSHNLTKLLPKKGVGSNPNGASFSFMFKTLHIFFYCDFVLMFSLQNFAEIKN